MNSDIEKNINKYNKVKLDLMRISKCIECCASPKEKETYQNIAIEYTKELKRMNSALENIYGIKICGCCKFEE
ncbi:hypothetical protein P9293_00045 [Bacillus inaquosorum]|uniref:hypothetical protein n=1 Tax=Bacillus subtilis group TaxID=653685 RepID=UPI000D023AC8|nr:MULTISPECIES: hypothetical protein [Bacillus subtilis group]MEC0596615.1 hypothetical protein [Bacillus spizizenii]MDQ7723546.1 hypothetical protein [Bacillus halotolerans]MED4645801.1 hypothetical protein [Bacillus inaquosorum]MED4790652.1 hypothetical protein [Bacillus inaquosorum]PRP56866.1 hypothetical protein C7B71_02665 [Bacillus halotolerans]